MVKLNRKSGFKVVSFWLRTRGLGVRVPQGACYKAPETAETVTETAFSGAFFIYAPLCHFCSKPLFYYQIPCHCEGSVKEREGFVKVLLLSVLLFNFKFQQYALWVYFTFNQRIISMITQETALRIWQCYREIEASQKLIEDVEACIGKCGEPTPLNPNVQRVEMGVPFMDRDSTARKIYQVQPKLAISVMRAHIANKEAELKEANECAIVEVGLYASQYHQKSELPLKEPAICNECEVAPCNDCATLNGTCGYPFKSPECLAYRNGLATGLQRGE